MGNVIVSVDHIGSTSIPGLAAKDVLDIQVTVRDLDLPIQTALEGLGFQLGRHIKDHAPPGFDLHPEELAKRYYKSKKGPVHLHVRKEGAFNQRYALLFRDYLRATHLARDAYGEIKKILAQRFSNDVDAYYDIKDPVCDTIMAGAYLWDDQKVRKCPNELSAND